MPLYEYECSACGYRFEKIQRFSDQLVQECPSCGKGPVHKLLSAPAFQFKGTGWYVTDYAGKSGGNDPAGSKDGAKGDAKSDAKTDTAPAAPAPVTPPPAPGASSSPTKS